MNKRLRSAQQGFTLIEVLVALALFAIIGVLSVRGLSSAIQVHRRINNHSAQLTMLAVTDTLMRNDMRQLIQLVMSTPTGHTHSPLSGDQHGVCFLQMAKDPQQVKDDVMDVCYQLRDHQLRRVSHPLHHPDQPDHVVMMMDHVSNWHVRYIDSRLSTTTQWPTMATIHEQTLLPVAVVITLEHAQLGTVSLWLATLAQAHNHAAQ